MRQARHTINAAASLITRIAVCVALSLAIQTQSAQPTASVDELWWKHAVLYEIYPRSFQDSNGDGVGDLNGITQRLGYLENLGVDAIWIAPIFPTGGVDFGYDVADYQSIDPQFGTMADFDRLMAEAGRHHIRVLLDMVLNHTSDQHKWFVESRSSRLNAKSDWYLWNDGVAPDAVGITDFQRHYEHEGRLPPNNWVGNFGGSAWEWAPERKQFYYHNFYPQQPDLNWRNPAVEKAMLDAMRFWLDRGVSGFRLDAVTNMFEDPGLRNNPETGATTVFGDPEVKPLYTDNLPEVHAVMKRMRTMLDSYPQRPILLGETYLSNTAALDAWYGGAARDELHLPMDMLIGVRGAVYSAAHFRAKLDEVETQIHGSQPLLVFDNHDNARSWDRFGDGEHNDRIAKQIAAILLLSRATPLLYYGQEIGMVTHTPQRKEDVRDPKGITGWPKQKGRDGERTPMQWDGTTQAGFSAAAKTWLPTGADYLTRNVQQEQFEGDSLLRWYMQLISLRRSVPLLRDGDTKVLKSGQEDVLAFLRVLPGSSGQVLILLNMSAKSQPASLSSKDLIGGARALRTLAASDETLFHAASLDAVLPAYSSWVVEVSVGSKRPHAGTRRVQLESIPRERTQ